MIAYLVLETEGSGTGSYIVHAVCSTMNRALVAKTAYLADTIEKIEIDAPIPGHENGWHKWYVFHEVLRPGCSIEHTKLYSACGRESDATEDVFRIDDCYNERGYRIKWVGWAENEEHARNAALFLARQNGIVV